MTKKRLLLLSALVLSILLLVSLVFITREPARVKTVFISGVSSCSKGIDQAVVDHMGDTLYEYVRVANDFNKKSSQPSYKGSVRKGSCRQDKSRPVIADTGERLDVRTSSVIVDVPEVKQSWRMKYSWLGSGDALKVDLGMPVLSCPANNELLYGDFSCTKALNIQKYGTPDYDPILKYMPYSGEGFNLAYNSQGKQVIASITIPSDQKGNQELIENNKAIIPYWFEKRGLDINKYQVVYRILYE